MLTRRVAVAFSFLLSVCLGSCVGAEPNQVRLASENAADRAAQRAPERLDRDLFIAEQSLVERRDSLTSVRRRIEQVRANQAKAAAALEELLANVRVLEEDLDAATKRKAEIQAALGPLRALEKQLTERDANIAAANSALAAKQKELEGIQAKDRELEGRVATERAAAEHAAQELLGELSKLGELQKTIESALELVRPKPVPPPLAEEKPKAAPRKPPANGAKK